MPHATEPGCDACRPGASYSPNREHLTNVFGEVVPGGDLSGLDRRVFETATAFDEPDGYVSYQNDLVYRCARCDALWLHQYWEVETEATQFKEFGVRYLRRLPLSPGQLALIEAALADGRRLPHDLFA